MPRNPTVIDQHVGARIAPLGLRPARARPKWQKSSA